MNSLEQVPPAGTGPSVGRPPIDPVLELYKLEYERASIRYENIYKAIWQIFSYLAALSGAVLAFGSQSFQRHWLGFLVSFPLVFWFIATYLALDRYGNSVLRRLREIEDRVNGIYGTDLQHYSRFEAQRSGLRGFLMRVRPKVWALGTFLFIIMVWNLVEGLRNPEPWIRQRPGEVKIVTLTPEEVKKLGEATRPAERSPNVSATPEKKP